MLFKIVADIYNGCRRIIKAVTVERNSRNEIKYRSFPFLVYPATFIESNISSVAEAFFSIASI